jgi:hypothetical protein
MKIIQLAMEKIKRVLDRKKIKSVQRYNRSSHYKGNKSPLNTQNVCNNRVQFYMKWAFKSLLSFTL